MASRITVDTITEVPVHEEYVLYLIEDGPWPDTEAQWDMCLRRIQARVLDAVDVALDGLLAQKYPNSVGKKVRIQVDSPHGIPPRLGGLLQNIRGFLTTDEQYASAAEASKCVQGIRLVTGHEMGRFRQVCAAPK